MHIIQVYLQVRPEFEDEFIEVSRYNAAHTRNEPGALRFDLLREKDCPGHYSLWEVYRTPQDADAHKQTEHYRRWVVAMEHCLAQDRTRTFWNNVDPGDEDYR